MATIGDSNRHTTRTRDPLELRTPRAPFVPCCCPMLPSNCPAPTRNPPPAQHTWFAALAHTHTHLAGASRHNRRDPAWHRRHACEEQRPYRPQCYVPPVPLRFGRLPQRALLPRAIDDGRRGRRVERSDTIAQPDTAAVVPLATHGCVVTAPVGKILAYRCDLLIRFDLESDQYQGARIAPLLPGRHRLY